MMLERHVRLGHACSRGRFGPHLQHQRSSSDYRYRRVVCSRKSGLEQSRRCKRTIRAALDNLSVELSILAADRSPRFGLSRSRRKDLLGGLCVHHYAPLDLSRTLSRAVLFLRDLALT